MNKVRIYRVEEIKEKLNWFKDKMVNSNDTGELDYIWHRDIKINMHNVSKLYNSNNRYTKNKFDNEFAQMKKDLKSFYSLHRQNLVSENKIGLKMINKNLVDKLYDANTVRVLDATWHKTIKVEIKELEEKYKYKKNLNKVTEMKLNLVNLYRDRRKKMIHDEKMKIEKSKVNTNMNSGTTLYEAMKEGFYEEYTRGY